MSIFSTPTVRVGLPRTSGLLLRIKTALAVREMRRSLVHLDDHLLADIGISRADAEREASRSIWDAPVHWRG